MPSPPLDSSTPPPPHGNPEVNSARTPTMVYQIFNISSAPILIYPFALLRLLIQLLPPPMIVLILLSLQRSLLMIFLGLVRYSIII